MKRMVEVFSLIVISITLSASFCGLAAARFRGTLRVTYSIGWNPALIPSPNGGQVQIVANNTGSPAIVRFNLTITGGTVTAWEYDSGWDAVVISGNTASFEASSAKYAISQHKYWPLSFEWTGPYSPGFTGTWYAYDKKGNLAVTSTFSWSYP